VQTKTGTPMRLRHNPFPNIFSQGDASTQLICLDFFDLGESPRARRCLQELAQQQEPEGCFPSGLDPSCWGMQETVRNALLLLHAGSPPDEENVQSAVRFILDHQKPDGSWCENPELVIPPEQVWLSNRLGITWLTADVVELLHQLRLADQPEYLSAIAWLRSVRNSDGGWPSLASRYDDQQVVSSDPDSTAKITFLMEDLFGEDDQVFLSGKALFERYLDECARDVERGYWVRDLDGKRGDIEVYHLTHLFLSWLLDPPRRFQRGYDVHDPRVKRIMAALIEFQNVDGGWAPFWAENSSPVYTLIAIKVLILSRMLNKEDLKSDLCLHYR
jgi:squalene cyclase